MSQLHVSAEQVRREWQSLWTVWSMARQKWQDGVADRFEREFFHAWETDMNVFLDRLDELNNVLQDALRHTAE